MLYHDQAEFTPPVESGTGMRRMPVRSIVLAVAAGACAIITVFGIAWWRGCLRQKDSQERGKN